MRDVVVPQRILMTNKETPLSTRIFEKRFVEVKGMFGIGGGRAYQADEVEDFLTETGDEVKNLESTIGKLYKFYKAHRNSSKVTEEKTTENESMLDNASKSLVNQTEDERIRKMMKHMNELLYTAEERAEQRILEAEMEAREIVERANEQAKNILETAQKESNEVDKRTKEKMEELVTVRKEIEVNAKKIRDDFEQKAKEVELMGASFEQMGKQLREIISSDEKSESA